MNVCWTWGFHSDEYEENYQDVTSGSLKEVNSISEAEEEAKQEVSKKQAPPGCILNRLTFTFNSY
jgi:hypothetical protein